MLICQQYIVNSKPKNTTIMKKRLALFALIITFLPETKAQDSTEITYPDTAQVTVYAGLTGGAFIDVTNSEVTKYANMRAGVMMKKKFSKHFSFHGWLGYDPGDQNVIVRGSFKYTGNNTGISAGFQPTPVSQIRPAPLSVDGQAEYTAESMVPGAAVGTTLWYKEYTAGLYIRNGKAEYQFAYLGEIFSAGIWTSADKFGGATAKVELPNKLYAMVSASSENQQGISLGFQPVKIQPYRFLWDFAVRDKKVIANMIGAQYYFSLKKFPAARFNVLYDFITKSAGVMFLVSIEQKE